MNTAPPFQCILGATVHAVSMFAIPWVPRLVRAQALPFTLGCLPLVAPPAALAQCERQKLTASDVDGGSEDFGFSISVSGDTAVNGAQADDDAFPSDPNCVSGSAYVFRRVGASWVEQTKLTASDAACGDHFGASVSIDGDVIVVGAWGKDVGVSNERGAAYVFRRSGGSWIEEQKLTPADAAAGDYFGSSVSVSGSRVLVGAPDHPCDAGDACGAAYVYRFDSAEWVEEAQLVASDAKQADWFGSAVFITDEIAIVGAEGDDYWCPGDPNCNAGSAYVFRFNGVGWVEEAKLVPSSGEPDEHFGNALALDENMLIVGAFRGDCADGPDCGGVYVFKHDGITWTQEAKLSASDQTQSSWFGSSVTVQHDTLIVGAMFDDCVAGHACGAAYVFRRDDNNTPADDSDDAWVEEVKLVASDPDATDYFGYSIAMVGNVALVGAAGDDGACPGGGTCNAGAVYVYSVPVCLGIPLVSTWGVVVLGLLLVTVGTLLIIWQRDQATWSMSDIR